MKVVTVQEMVEIERSADDSGLHYDIMLENAGNNLGKWIYANFTDQQKYVIGLIGSGNNGGDALVALEFLAKRGWICFAYIVKARFKSDPYQERLKLAGGILIEPDADRQLYLLESILSRSSIILDGILGTGFQQPLAPELATRMHNMKEIIRKSPLKHQIVAVDCPSGVDCDTGEVVDCVLTADYTTCMAAVKQGLLEFPAFSYCGNLVEIKIGLPDDFPLLGNKTTYVLNPQTTAMLLPHRPINAHKGSYGTSLIYAGSQAYTGAAYLAGKAAYLAGVGLVHMLVESDVHQALAGQLLEAIWTVIPASDALKEAKAFRTAVNSSRRYQAVLLGSGIGQTDQARRIFLEILFGGSNMGNSQPLIIDADGLRMLVEIDGWWEKLSAQTILTPHPGEMAVLTGLSVTEIQANRVAVVRKFAKQWQKIIILKGALTAIANPEGRVAIVPIASSALATAGTGDILAGFVTGLCAQGLSPFEAAQLAAFVHARAGQFSANKVNQTASVTALDVLEAIPEVLGN